MSDRAAAVAYLIPPHGSVWTWEDNGQSIAWTSGETIAFRQELLTVIRWLAPGGLPPFAAIVLVLAATRDGWNLTSRRLLTHAQDICLPGGGDPTSASGVTLRAIGHRLEGDTATIIASLDRIAALPAELRHPLAAKGVLAEVIFEGTERAIAPDVAVQVVAELEGGADPATFDLGRPPNTAVRELVDTIDSLQAGLQKIDAERLLLRLRTGLDQEIQPPAEDLGPARRVHRLLADLADDPELGGLSRLARNLLAAVHVPRLLHHHEQLPAGGVSDISNRGQLDRLLISELAHDDLTLAVRVAVNEALYLQRESPPREPPHRRVMLIDTGIRTWGVPRVYATAVAMALAATADVQGELAGFRPQGDEIAPVDLTTREGVMSHLESLETRPHFGSALPAFIAEVSTAADRSEAFLITQEEVLEDPEFRAALQKLDSFNGYAATVGRDGAFRLWSLSSTGRTLLRQAKLDVEQLLAPPKKLPSRSGRPLVHPAAHLPVILSTQPFPLLLTPMARLRQIAANDSGEKAAVTRDNQLVLWNSYQFGARLLCDRMPRGRLDLLRFTIRNTAVLAVLSSIKRATVPVCTLCVADFHRGMQAPIQLAGIDELPRAVTVREDVIFVIGRKTARAYGLQSGEPIAILNLSGARWLRGRLFESHRELCLLSLIGSSLTLERIPTILPWSAPIFEVGGIDGPLLMAPDGEIRSVAQSPEVIRAGRLKEPIVFEGVSCDGRAIVARSANDARKHHYLEFAPNEAIWRSTTEKLQRILDGTARHFISGFPLRRNFSGILAGDQGSLFLLARDGKLVEIKLSGSILHLTRSGYTVSPGGDSIRPFIRTAAPRGTGYHLHVASWNDTSQAFLDSRGMLHLKSANRTIPEITLALTNEGDMAGWSSDGRVYGPKFFHGSDTSYDPRHLEELLRRFTEHLR